MADIKHVNSVVDRDFRNRINQLIDIVNGIGTSLNDLVVKGVMTTEQYSQLLTAINGLVKIGEVDLDTLSADLKTEIEQINNKIDKGNVSVFDINKNLGKLDQTFLSDELLQQIAGTAPINAVPADDSITSDKLVKESVTPDKTSFFKPSEINLFNGEYKKWALIGGSGNYRLVENYDPYFGGLAIIPVSPNTTYTIKIHEKEKSNVFRIGWSKDYPKFVDNQFYLTGAIPTINLDSITWTNDDSNYLYAYVSNNGSNPKLQVEEGDEASDFQSYFILDEDLIPKKEETKEHNIVIEDPVNGYPLRPDLPSVVYHGVSEPTDAEPFDEWRKTGGYPYFFDLSKTDTTEFTKFGTENIDLSIKTDFYDGKSALSLNSTTPSIKGVIWDKVKDDYMKTQEMFSEMRTNSTNYRSASHLHYYSSDGVNESYYAIGVYGTSLIITKKTLEGSNTDISVKGTTINTTVPFRLRTRVTEDGVIMAKIWQADQNEPLAWGIEFKDSTALIPTRNIGLYSFFSETSVRELGVSTGGMTAPKRKWW